MFSCLRSVLSWKVGVGCHYFTFLWGRWERDLVTDAASLLGVTLSDCMPGWFNREWYCDCIAGVYIRSSIGHGGLGVFMSL